MRLLGLLTAAAALAAAGCGGTPPSIEGAVSYDGVPVQNGTITFLPNAEKAKKLGGPIVDGRYKVESAEGAAPGAYKVEIHWRKPTGKKYKSDSGEFDVVTEGLPAKFNDATTLTADVTPGANVIDFNLTK